MQPPWIKFPELERDGVGWRMGYGEEYYDTFYRWFSNLSETERTHFEIENPEPQEWKGFFRMIAERPWKSS